MRFSWIKLGRIIKPGRFDWMKTHAQNPFAEKIAKDLYRVYFAGRDKNNFSRGGYALIDINKPSNILDITKKPILEIGELGCFDDCGAMPSCVVTYQKKKYLYYTGWTQKVRTPFVFFIGLTISNDGGKTFQKYGSVPVLDRNPIDPQMTCSPFVLIEKNLWRMWYVSCTKWELEKRTDTLKHYYHIKYAESKNGIEWTPTGIVCIDFQKDEYAIARPEVIKTKNGYQMWYCYRGGDRTYRAGYAESCDGIKWNRKDDLVALEPSKNGWDRDMICYPWVFRHQKTDYMLYNGGRYGRTGCGLAKLEGC